MINILVHARTHDNAGVVSAEFEVETLNTTELLGALVANLAKVNAWAEQSGAIIGHVKAFVKPCEGSVTLSTVGETVNIVGAISYDVGITGIIFAELSAVQEQITNVALNTLADLEELDVSVELCSENHEHSHHHEHHHHD